MTTFFFDLDGTLCDSRPGLLLSFQAAFNALKVSVEELDRFLGTPLPEAFRSVMASISDKDIAHGIDAFRQEYEARGIFQTPLYRGAAALLSSIRQQGHHSWLVTSKPQKYAEQVVTNLGIKNDLRGVVGAGLDESDTKTGLIARALRESAARPNQCLMLGDRSYDVIGALENGVTPVGALWGYGSRRELEEAGCREFCDDLAQFHERFLFLAPSLFPPEQLPLATARRQSQAIH
ncbi:HAD hydrolase-like protein [Phaeospirillum tilakii]|uniref:HAD hydrolase-like protein n=1 Tax=Phaeospirillum tilakii TaxID=741673 RepID=A0ABW5CBV8_9PROT